MHNIIHFITCMHEKYSSIDLKIESASNKYVAYVGEFISQSNKQILKQYPAALIRKSSSLFITKTKQFAFLFHQKNKTVVEVFLNTQTFLHQNVNL